MWQPTQLTPRQIKLRQRRAIAAIEAILRSELPNTLGMSAQATSLYLIDGSHPRGRPEPNEIGLPVREPAEMGDLAPADVTPVKGSSFHLATIYQQQVSGESSGYLMPFSQGVMLRDFQVPAGGHPRGEWLTWYTAIRFAETYGALLGESKVVIADPPLDAAPLLECLDCDITMDERFGTLVAVKQIEVNLQPLAGMDRASEIARLVRAYLVSHHEAPQWRNFQLLKPITPYQMKQIRSLIGIDSGGFGR